jgi:lambda repressor-like predicted transcriptional regulator
MTDAPQAPRNRAGSIPDDPGLREGDNPRGFGTLVSGGRMSVVLHAGRLHQEMGRRGWAATDLARESRLSQATISTAFAGKPIAEKSLSLIAAALSATPPNVVIDSLILSRLSDRDLE